MTQPAWEPARLEIDEGLGPYDAEILTNQRCNGWVIPRFTRDVAVRVAADIATANTVQVLADDDPDRAATNAYPAVAHLDEVAGVHLARLGYDDPHGTPSHVDVTCARDIPGEGICLRRPGHGGGGARS